MLHLQAGVDLQEVEVVAPGIVEEFHGSGGPVVDRLRQADSGVDEGLAGGVRQVRRRSLLHHLLVAPLQGTVALAQGDHPAPPVPEHLDLDVPGLGDIAFEEDPRVGEGSRGHAHDGAEGGKDLALGLADLHADAPAPGGGLEDDGEADLPGRCEGGVSVGQEVGPGGQGRAMGPGQVPGGVLETEGADVVRRGADEGDARRLAGLRKGRILGQESVPRMDRLRPRRPGGGQHGLDVEVALPRRGGPDAHRLVGLPDMGRACIGIGEDGHGSDAHPAQGADDPAGDGAAVGDQDLVEHASHPTPGAVMIMRTGVGLKPLQGLFTCGQFETTTTRSISARRST